MTPISYKFRIYPTKEQKVLIEKHFGCCRWIYNWALSKNIESYQKEGIHLSRFILQKEIPILKKLEETSWLSEVNSQSLISSLEHLEISYTKFFKEKKGFPKFKSRQSEQSFSVPQSTKVDFDNSRVFIPKFPKGIKCKFSRRFTGVVKTSTVTKSPSGKYYISILVETDQYKSPKKSINIDKAVGIDLGIKTFATLSNGDTIENPRHLNKSLQKLKRLSREFSKKQPGSKNKNKTRIKLARQHEKVSNQRKDFLHKVTTRISQNYDTVCLETLYIPGMLKNSLLSKSISDLGIGIFNKYLEYKTEWYGCNFLKIGRFEPSSKTCSNCGNIKQNLTLSDRIYNCDKCGISIDRDLNAAIVIKNIALLNNNTVRHTEI